MWSWSKRGLTLTATIAGLLACAGEGSSPPRCVTGMQVHCGCVGGAIGVQTCADGAYLPCACPSPLDASTEATPDAALDARADTPPDAPRDGAPDSPLDAVVAPDRPLLDAMADLVASDGAGDLGPSLAAPRPLAPGSAGVVATARPTFRWSLPPGATGARVELCRDRALTEGCTTLDAAGTHVAPAAGLASGAWFWRVRAVAGGAPGAAGPTWTFSLGARPASSDATLGTTVDVNGDGYADVVVGTRHASAAFIYHGGPAALGTAPSRALAYLPGEVSDVQHAGDVDGDGYTDLLVYNSARLRLHRGGASGVEAAPMEVPTPPGEALWSASGVGDVNRDGYADVYLVHMRPTESARSTASLYLGGAAGFTRAGGVTGAGYFFDHQLQASAAGDVNADGYADVALWNPVNGSEVRVYLGGPTGPAAAPALTLTYDQPTPRVTGPGDLNGDGFGDLIVTPNYTTSAATYHGGPSGITPVVTHTLAGGPTYQSAPAGDVNGDGYADVLFGEGSSPPDTRAVHLRFGSAAGLSRTAALTTRGPGYYGVAVGGPGDVNGDGFADVVVGSGATSFRGTLGVAQVYDGAAGGPATLPTRTLEDPTRLGYGTTLLAMANGYAVGGSAGPIAVCDISGLRSRNLPGSLLGGYGAAVAVAGDTNLTGGDEVAVGAPGLATVFVLLDGVRTVALTGPTGSELGAALVGPLDFDGDRFADVVAGAPGAARVLVFLGGTFGPLAASPTTLSGPSGSRFGAALGLVGDVDRDGSPDLVVGAPGAHQVFLYRGGPAGTSTTPASVLTGPADSEFGAAVLGVGDLDRDGYADVAVGAPGADRVYVHRGGPGGLLAAPWAVLVGAAGGRFGSALTVALNARFFSPDERALVVGAPAAARASLYEITRAGVAATPFLGLTGPVGSRFGASLVYNTIQGLMVGAPGAHAVHEYPHSHDARGVLLPLGSASNVTTAPPSDFGAVVGARFGG